MLVTKQVSHSRPFYKIKLCKAFDTIKAIIIVFLDSHSFRLQRDLNMCLLYNDAGLPSVSSFFFCIVFIGHKSSVFYFIIDFSNTKGGYVFLFHLCLLSVYKCGKCFAHLVKIANILIT